MNARKKIKTKLCWLCGNKLYQNKICVKKVIDGHERTLHKFCAEHPGLVMTLEDRLAVKQQENSNFKGEK